MEQFASNFPISNNISAANGEGFVRPTHNTDKSLPRPEGGVGGAEREHRVKSVQTRLHGLLRKPLRPLEGRGVCAAGHVGAGCLGRDLAGSQSATEMPRGLRGLVSQPPT